MKTLLRPSFVPLSLLAFLLLAGPRNSRAQAFIGGLFGSGWSTSRTTDKPEVEASTPEPPRARKPDLARFLERLESIGLETTYLRRIAAKVEPSFRGLGEASGGAHDEGVDFAVSGTSSVVLIPTSFEEAETGKIRFELSPGEVGDLVHGFTHAAFHLAANKRARLGSPDREHYEAVKAVWSDRCFRKKGDIETLPGKSQADADEIVATFLGNAMAEVFEALDTIIELNLKHSEDFIFSPEQAKALGAELVLPERAGPDGFGQNLLKLEFGKVNACITEVCEERELCWQEQAATKQRIFRQVLGLNPPRDPEDLVMYVNSSDSPWARALRRKVAAARDAHINWLRHSRMPPKVESWMLPITPPPTMPMTPPTTQPMPSLPPDTDFPVLLGIPTFPGE